MDKLSALNIYRRVVELNGFSAAAKDLDYSSAAVSKNIQALEAELGARLLNRTTRRITLTDAGRIYYEKICQILDNLDNADQLITDLSYSPRGNLKINVPMSVGINVITPHIPQFLKAFPDIKIDFVMSDYRVDLLSGGFDIGIRAGAPLKDSTLIGKKLTNLKRTLCASTSYLNSHPPLTHPSELAHHECLIYSLSESSDFWQFTQQKDLISIEVSGSFKANNSLALREVALGNQGIALLPEAIVKNHLADGSLVNLLPDWLPSQQSIYIVYPQHKEQSQALKVFVNFMAECFDT